MSRKIIGILHFAGKPKVGARGVLHTRTDAVIVSVTTRWPDRDRFTFEADYRGRKWRGTGSPGTGVTLRQVTA